MDKIHIWTAKDNPRIQLESDGNQFICTIHAGMAWETILSVGYSCPNYALSSGLEEWCAISMERMIALISASLDVLYQKLPWYNSLEAELPNMLEMCKDANETYNRWAINKPLS